MNDCVYIREIANKMNITVFHGAIHIEQWNMPKESIANAISHCQQAFVMSLVLMYDQHKTIQDPVTSPF